MGFRGVATTSALLLWLMAAAGADSNSGTVRLQGKNGQVVLQWVSGSSFRFCRAWEDGHCAARTVAEAEQVEVKRADTEVGTEFRTKFLIASVEKDSLRLRVSTVAGEILLEDLRPPEFANGGVVVERGAGRSDRFYGLGARSQSATNVRRRRIEATTPFLISSAGYGLHHVGPGDYTFELADAEPDRYRVLIRGARALDFFFYYGPSPKEILEEHKKVAGAPAMLNTWQLGVIQRNQLPQGATALAAPREGSWGSLRVAARAMINASMSAILVPAFDLTPYLSAPIPLFRRAMLLGIVSPVVFLESPAVLLEPDKLEAFHFMTQWRKRLQSYLLTYAAESTTRGLPILHPLPLQFPSDAEAAKADDGFMLGDEILAAPILSESGRRQVYLPMGFWTDLATNQVHRGRQTIEIVAAEDAIPMFVKNGSILPLDPRHAQEPTMLHYVPKLAAEFFLYEPDIGDYSQLHAGPAGESMRLEIESLKTRPYQWVVHHMPEAREAVSGNVRLVKVEDASELRPGSWWYDQERGDIHVRVDALKGADTVVYLHGRSGAE